MSALHDLLLILNIDAGHPSDRRLPLSLLLSRGGFHIRPY